ncbi:MAG: NADH-quinone oxidoreductase subunit NuoH [Azospirillum brasilense]|nr:MAG: NADH-quinone oxidoreductase subunit NuoH [Azospirillum brasilense]
MQEFLNSPLWLENILPTMIVIGRILLVTVPLLISVAMLTYMERKVIASMQLRRGPNVVGPFGLLQPFADGLKLFLKETIIPTKANKVMFLLAPVITFALALLGWAVVPISKEFVIANLNVGVLYLFAISSLGVYGIIISGWASNSKYAFLGAIRSSAQMVSYEVSIGLVIITVLLCVGSLNLGDIVQAQAGGIGNWYVCSGLFPMFVVFFISGLAETNRLPFDLPEAEGELVAGYNVEYSSMSFALFFLGEYANMILICGMTTILFLGGWQAPLDVAWLSWVPTGIWFALKVVLCLYVFLWVRATFPRYRYDQLMRLGWKIFLPLSLLWVVGTAGYLVFTDTLPDPKAPVAAAVEQELQREVTLKRDGTLVVRQPRINGGHAELVVQPDDEGYDDLLETYAPIKKGETKTMPLENVKVRAAEETDHD